MSTISRSNASAQFTQKLSDKLEDGKLTPAEAKELQTEAKNLTNKAADKAGTALDLQQTLISVDSALAANNIIGSGPTKSEVYEAGTDAIMQKTRKMLGAILGQNLPATPTTWTPAAKEAFLKDFAEMAGGVELMGPGAIFPFVDKQLAPFDSKGISGSAKLKLDKQRETLTAEILKETTVLSKDVDDRFADVIVAETYRMATGHYLAPEIKAKMEQEIAGISNEKLGETIAHLQNEVTRLGKEEQTFAVRNYTAAMKEGVEYFKSIAAQR